jgi:hypothetical protein
LHVQVYDPVVSSHAALVSHGLLLHSFTFVHVTDVNTGVALSACASHVAVPPPEKPVSHVTVTTSVVEPVMAPDVLLSEWATCVAAQGFAVHSTVENKGIA